MEYFNNFCLYNIPIIKWIELTNAMAESKENNDWISNLFPFIHVKPMIQMADPIVIQLDNTIHIFNVILYIFESFICFYSNSNVLHWIHYLDWPTWSVLFWPVAPMEANGRRTGDCLPACLPGPNVSFYRNVFLVLSG